LEGGDIFDKAGVNVTKMKIPLSKTLFNHMKSQDRLKGCTEEQGLHLYAGGISLIFHPANPNMPTVHANYRMIIIYENEKLIHWWFGGGSDLTPILINTCDAVHFHQGIFLKMSHLLGPKLFWSFKEECDNYFKIEYRHMSRGIGGIFYDDFNKGGDFDQILQF
jgi:coproporphyrinogen III oxidase